MKTYIYTLSHPETGEIRYVGKTTNLKRRSYQHFNAKICKKLSNKHLGNWLLSILNSGLKPTLEIIEECADNWIESEQYWIEQFKHWGFNLLNITKGGEGFGCKHSKETIEKLKLSLTGRKLSKEHIDKIKTNFLGKKHTEETKKILSEKHTGKKISKESIEKMKKARTGKSAYWNNIKVSSYDINGNFIKTFESIKEASIYYSIAPKQIIDVLKNRGKICHKLQFRYGDNKSCIGKPILRKLNHKGILRLSLDDKIIDEFSSAQDAAEKLNLLNSNIYQCLNNKRKTAYGYKWKYK